MIDLVCRAGGLAFLLALLLGKLSKSCEPNRVENLLVRQLFRPTPDTDFSEVQRQSQCRECCQRCLSGCLHPLCCLRQSRKDKLYLKGRNLLAKELDVVQLVRKLRYYDLALNKLV